MHKYNNQDGPTRQSVQIDSASENEKKNKITVLWGCAADTQPKNRNKIDIRKTIKKINNSIQHPVQWFKK